MSVKSFLVIQLRSSSFVDIERSSSSTIFGKVVLGPRFSTRYIPIGLRRAEIKQTAGLKGHEMIKDRKLYCKLLLFTVFSWHR